MYYTTDGSEPTAENTAINSNTLRLEPTGDKEITLKVLAVKGDAKSEVASTSIVFRQEREIILQIDKEASCYDNSEQINVTVSAGNADILYALDYLDANREGSLTDVAKNGVATEGDISVDFCEYPGGGTLVLQAVAMVDGEIASPVARLDLTFTAKNEDAFLVDGIGYHLFSDALHAVEASTASSILYLQKDVELGSEVLLPNKAITIASTGSALQYTFKADSIQLQQDIIFSNVLYDIANLYANGHNVTIDNDVTAPFALLGHRIFAGCPYGENGMNTLMPSELATISLVINGSGNYTIYGSGAVGTSMDNMNVDIITSGIDGKAARAIWGSTMDGVVTLNGEALEDNIQVEVGGGSR